VNGQLPFDSVTENIRLRTFKSSLSDNNILSLTPPSSDVEKLYGKNDRLKLQFSSNLILTGLDNGDGFLDMTLTQWDKNPYLDGKKLKSPQLTIKTKTLKHSNNDNNYLSSSLSIITPYNYYLSFNFDRKQDFISLNGNITFPSCSIYDILMKTFVIGCPGCNIVSYTEYDVTYGCDDVSRLLALDNYHRSSSRSSSSNQTTFSNDDTSSNLADDDDKSATDDGNDDYINGKQTSISSINYGALLSTFSSTLSGNPFAINFQQTKIIIFLVSSIFITIIFGCMYYSRVDLMNRQKSIYIEMNNNNNNNNCNKNDIKDENKNNYKNNNKNNNNDIDIYNTIFNDDDDDDDFNFITNLESNSSNQNDYINKIIKKDFIEKVFDFDGFLSDNSQFSFFKQDDKKEVNKDKNEDNEVNVTSQLSGWISFWINILTSIFIDTLFFSTFFPDNGQCETFITQNTCILLINHALNTPLCIWKIQKKIINGGTCILSPPPSDITFTFILVILTIIITIPIVMLINKILFYAFQRPQLSLWGWNEEFWLGKRYRY